MGSEISETGLRLHVYDHIVAQRRAPTVREMADVLGLTAEQVHRALKNLAEKHVLVLESDTGEVRMAMPFSAVRTAYRVAAGNSHWWAN